MILKYIKDIITKQLSALILARTWLQPMVLEAKICEKLTPPYSCLPLPIFGRPLVDLECPHSVWTPPQWS